jgi:hypothetical protein
MKKKGNVSLYMKRQRMEATEDDSLPLPKQSLPLHLEEPQANERFSRSYCILRY